VLAQFAVFPPSNNAIGVGKLNLLVETTKFFGVWRVLESVITWVVVRQECSSIVNNGYKAHVFYLGK